MLHGGCLAILHIWNNRLIGDPFWKISCCILGWIPTRTIFIVYVVLFDTSLLPALVTSNAWSGKCIFSITIENYIEATLIINLLHRLVEGLINYHSVRLLEQRLLLIIFFYGIGLPLILFYKAAIFKNIILYKVFLGYYLCKLYDILSTHRKFINKLYNTFVPINHPDVTRAYFHAHRQRNSPFRQTVRR